MACRIACRYVLHRIHLQLAGHWVAGSRCDHAKRLSYYPGYGYFFRRYFRRSEFPRRHSLCAARSASEARMTEPLTPAIEEIETELDARASVPPRMTKEETDRRRLENEHVLKQQPHSLWYYSWR